MQIQDLDDGESNAPTEEDDDHGRPVELAGQPFQRVVIGFPPGGFLGGFPGGPFPPGVFPGGLGGHLGAQLGMGAESWPDDAEAAECERQSLQAEVERLQEELALVTVEVASLEEAPLVVEEDPELPQLRERAASLREDLAAAEEEGQQLRAVADDLDREIESNAGLLGQAPPEQQQHDEHAAVAEELGRRKAEHENLTAQGEELDTLLTELRSRRAEREQYAQELLARFREVQERQAETQAIEQVFAVQGDDEELEAVELQAELARLIAENTQLKAQCQDLKQTAQKMSEEHEEAHFDASDSPEVKAELARAHGELEALRAANAKLKAQCANPATVARDVNVQPSVSPVLHQSFLPMPVSGQIVVPSSTGHVMQQTMPSSFGRVMEQPSVPHMPLQGHTVMPSSVGHVMQQPMPSHLHIAAPSSAGQVMEQPSALSMSPQGYSVAPSGEHFVMEQAPMPHMPLQRHIAVPSSSAHVMEQPMPSPSSPAQIMEQPSRAGSVPQLVERRASPQFSTVPLPPKLRSRTPDASAGLSAAPPAYKAPATRTAGQTAAPQMQSVDRAVVLTSVPGASAGPQQFSQLAPTGPPQTESRDVLVRSAPAAAYAAQRGQNTPPNYLAPPGRAHTGNLSATLPTAPTGPQYAEPRPYAGGNLTTTVPMVHIMGQSHT